MISKENRIGALRSWPGLPLALVAGFSMFGTPLGDANNFAATAKGVTRPVGHRSAVCSLPYPDNLNPPPGAKTAIFYEDAGIFQLPNGATYCAYSGEQGGLNNPYMQWIKNIGAIPNGYYAAARVTDDHHFKVRGKAFKGTGISLMPFTVSQTLARDSFAIHQPHFFSNGLPASAGCIVSKNIEAIFQARRRGDFDRIYVTETSGWTKKHPGFPYLLAQKRIHASAIQLADAGKRGDAEPMTPVSSSASQPMPAKLDRQ